MSALIEAKGLSHSFDVGRGIATKRKLRALVDVELSVAKGDVFGLVGESGSGIQPVF